MRLYRFVIHIFQMLFLSFFLATAYSVDPPRHIRKYYVHDCVETRLARSGCSSDAHEHLTFGRRPRHGVAVGFKVARTDPDRRARLATQIQKQVIFSGKGKNPACAASVYRTCS